MRPRVSAVWMIFLKRRWAHLCRSVWVGMIGRDTSRAGLCTEFPRGWWPHQSASMTTVLGSGCLLCIHGIWVLACGHLCFWKWHSWHFIFLSVEMILVADALFSSYTRYAIPQMCPHSTVSRPSLSPPPGMPALDLPYAQILIILQLPLCPWSLPQSLTLHLIFPFSEHP